MKIDGGYEGNIKWVMRDIFFDEIGSLGGLKEVKSGIYGDFTVFTGDQGCLWGGGGEGV